MSAKHQGHATSAGCTPACPDYPRAAPAPDARDATPDDLRGAVERLAVAMGGVGSHREPCRLPDTSCLCGVCDFRAEARVAIEGVLDRFPATPSEQGYQPCNHECNGCPTCDPGLVTPSEPAPEATDDPRPEYGTEDYRRYSALFNDISRADTAHHIRFSDRGALTRHLWRQGWRRDVRPEDVTER